MLLQQSATDSISISGDSSRQTGSYRQVCVTPGKDTMHLKGKFTANWKWYPAEGWRQQQKNKPAGKKK